MNNYIIKNKKINFNNYIKSQSSDTLRLITFLYTLKNIKTTKKEYLKLLKKNLINYKFYNNYTSLYDTLDEKQKESLKYYQTIGYLILNNYLRFNEVEILNETNLLLLQQNLNLKFNDLLLKNKYKFETDKKFEKKIMKTISTMYKLQIPKYNNNIMSINNHINILLQIINKFVLFDDMIVFRGVNYDKREHPIDKMLHETSSKKTLNRYNKTLNKIKKLKAGDTATEKGLTSCTLFPNIAKNFSGVEGCCIYRYFLKKGTSCFIYPLNENSMFLYEFEVLLKPHKYKIKNVHNIKEKNMKYKIIDVEIVDFLNVKPLRNPVIKNKSKLGTKKKSKSSIKKKSKSKSKSKSGTKKKSKSKSGTKKVNNI